MAPGAFIRTSDAERPTWLLDEADRYLNPKTAGEALTQAINAASYRRLARMRISVPTPDGGWTVQAFEFWCPMLLAGIRRLADTVQDRAIVLKMQRARPGELKHRLINGSSPRFRDAQRKLIRWAQDLERARPRPGGAAVPAQPRGRPLAAPVRARGRGRRALAGAGRSRPPGRSTGSAPKTPTAWSSC